jgi:hypothetical protein
MHGKEGHLAACETGHVDCPTNRLLAALDEAEQRAQKVRDLHRPSVQTNGLTPFCVGCWEAGGMDGGPAHVNCPTLRALDGETPARIAGICSECGAVECQCEEGTT